VGIRLKGATKRLSRHEIGQGVNTYRKGNFGISIGYLDKMDKELIDQNLKAAYYGLYATNLLILEKDIGLAEKYLRKNEKF